MPEEKKVESSKIDISKMEVKKIEVKKKRRVRKFFKSFVDVKKWISYDEVSSNAKSTYGLFRRLFSGPPKVIRKETYEEAIARMGLTEAQLEKRGKVFLYSSLIYGFFAIGLLTYFFYLLAHARLYGAILDLILFCLMSLTAYREHFWYMQMQKRKLGCTFHDWMDFVLRRTK